MMVQTYTRLYFSTYNSTRKKFREADNAGLKYALKLAAAQLAYGGQNGERAAAEYDAYLDLLLERGEGSDDLTWMDRPAPVE